MQAVVEGLNRWGDAAFELAAAALWQSTLVALLVVGAAWALRGAAPAVRYWLWQLVAVKLLLMPFWTWSLAVGWLPEEIATPPAPEVAQRPPALPPIAASSHVRAGKPATRTRVQHRPIAPRRRPVPVAPALSWSGWLLVAWGAIVLAQMGRLGVQRVWLAKLLRRSQPPGEALADVVVQAAARMGLVRAPRVLTTEVDCSPFVCGIVRPTLVMPRELADTLAAGDLAQIVAHELAHIQRRDLTWGWIPEIARIVYFFHPVAHWAARRVRLERELACDQRAMIASGRGPAEYADTLVRVLSAASSPSLFRTAAAEGAP